MSPGSDVLGGVSRETWASIEAFEDLVRRWTPRINLVSSSSLADLRQRHTHDSAQLVGLAPENARTWVDLGSGGGFPGLIVAIVAREQRPGLSVTLVESDARKAAFLVTAAHTLDLTVQVLRQRIEAPPFAPADVVSARALAPLTRLLDLAAPWAAPGAVCLFPKGASVDDELTAARACWHMDLDLVASAVEPASVVLRVREFRRVADG